MSNEITNPLQYFATYPDKIVELKKVYGDGLRTGEDTMLFDGQQLDMRYCKYLIEALDSSLIDLDKRMSKHDPTDTVGKDLDNG
jgi:hypothetical protein